MFYFVRALYVSRVPYRLLLMPFINVARTTNYKKLPFNIKDQRSTDVVWSNNRDGLELSRRSSAIEMEHNRVELVSARVIVGEIVPGKDQRSKIKFKDKTILIKTNKL